VEAADAGVVDEHVAVGVPPHRHRRVLLLLFVPVPLPAARRRLRRGGRVEEDVLEHDAGLGHRERRDRGVPVRRRHLGLARCDALCVALVAGAGAGAGEGAGRDRIGSLVGAWGAGGEVFKCGEGGMRRRRRRDVGAGGSAGGRLE